MPILKLDGKMVFYFGEGDIVFSSAYDKGDSEDNDYISFWQSETSYPIGKPMPELIGKEVDDWAVKMYFPSVESLQSVISVLVEYRDKKYPPKSEQGDSKNSSQAVQQTQKTPLLQPSHLCDDNRDMQGTCTVCGSFGS